MTKSFEELIVWQKAHLFVLEVYAFSEDFPSKEIYGLTSQFRRSAISIVANVVGYKKKGKADKTKIYEHFPGFIGRMQVLYYSVQGSKIY